MKNRLREELEAMLELRTGDSFTADNVHTLVNGIFAADEGGGFVFVEYDDNAFRYPQEIGSTADSISGLGPADETMLKTIFIMPNKETDPDATLMIVVDEKEPSTDPKTYQYVYVGNINDLPSDVLTEGSIVNDLSTGGTDKPLSAEQGRTLNSHVNYTTCESGAADQVKLISDDGFELSTHLRLLVSMTNTNTHATPKFNINNTGIKDVWYNGSVASDTNTWSAGEVLDVYYDGSKYIANTHGDAQFSTGEKVGDVGIDDEPTFGSDNLVKSGGAYEEISQLNQKLSVSAMICGGCEVNVTLEISSTSYTSRRKDFMEIPIISGKTYYIVLIETNASDLSTQGFVVYSSGDTTSGSKMAVVKAINTRYSFTCENSGVLRIYSNSGDTGDTISAKFKILDEDALILEMAKDSEVVKHTSQSLTESQKTQARTNIGAASEEYVDERTVDIEEESESTTEHYTKNSFDAQQKMNAYLRLSLSSIVEDPDYTLCYFYAPKDGTVYVNNSGMSATYFRMVVGEGTPQSYPNATKYQGGTDVLPSQSNPKIVHEGDLIAVSIYTHNTYVDNDFEIVYSYSVVQKYIPNENIHDYDKVLASLNLNQKITIKKVSDNEIRLLIPTKDGTDYLIHPIVHNTYTKDMTPYGGSANMVCGDNWDPGDTKDSNETTLVQGNLNFIYMVDSSVTGFENEDLHVGTGGGATSGHGLEVREYTLFFADGVQFSVESMSDDIECSVFRMIQKSNCYAPDSSISATNALNWPKLDNGNPIITAQHYLDAKFEIGNKITWRNRLLIKRNGVVFNQIHGGMLRSFTTKLNEVAVNDVQASRNHFEYTDGQYVITPIGDSVNLTWVNRYADEANMYGDGIEIFQRMIQDDGSRFKKSIMMCQKYEQQNLLSFKVYFMPALVTLRSSIQNAEVFNDGDIISVTNHREINV